MRLIMGLTPSAVGGTWSRRSCGGFARKGWVRRRLGGAAALCPFTGRAQQLSSILIGFLSASSAAAFTKEIDAFRDGLRKLGYIEGRNVRLECYRAGPA